MKRKPTTSALSLLFWWLTLTAQIQGTSEPLRPNEPDALSLSCVSESVGSTDDLKVICTLHNDGKSSYVLLGSTPILEGPQPGEHYLRVLVGGERVENVLQYMPHSVGTLDPPTLLKPCVHLSRQDLASLVRVKPESALSIVVLWPSGTLIAEEYNALLVRLKMMVISEVVLTERLESSELSKGCKGLVRITDQSRGEKDLILEATNAPEGLSYSFDGCRDRISESFRHLFSNTLTLRSQGDEEIPQ